MTVTDDLGRGVSLPAPPRRIVSLAPNTTEILYALGLGERIVAVADFSDYPPEAKVKPTVGRYDRPSLEKILSFRPDLVFVGYGSSKDLAPAIARAGAVSFAVNPQSIAETLDAIRRVGALCGVAQEADRLAADLRRRLDAAQASAKARTADAPRVFIMVDQEPLWTAGAETLQDEILRLAGGQNIATRPSFYPLSKEALLAAQPDMILLPAPAKEAAAVRQSVLSRRDLAGLTAIRRGRVITIDADTFSRPGPRVADAVEDLAAALQASASGRKAHPSVPIHS